MTSGTENYDRMNLEAGSDAFGGGNPVEITEPYSEGVHPTPDVGDSVARHAARTEHPQRVPAGRRGGRLRGRARDDSENTNVAATPRRRRGRPARRLLRGREGPATGCVRRLPSGTGDPAHGTPPPSSTDGPPPSIDGEVVGVIGEVHPAVLVEHDLEVPVAAFEFPPRRAALIRTRSSSLRHCVTIG